MAKKTYYEKLKDPRWQKLRLEVMQHSHFCCDICGDNEATLNIHHKEYFKGHEPWEYEVGQLACVCENCHKDEHSNKDALKYVSSFLDFDGPVSRDFIAFMIAGYVGMDLDVVLNESNYEMCAYATWAYQYGVQASYLKISLKEHIEMHEAKNG